MVNPNAPILAFAKDKNSIRFASSVAKACSRPLYLCDQFNEMVELSRSLTAYAAVLLFFESSQEVREFDKSTAGQLDPNRVHVICASQDEDTLRAALYGSSIGHIGLKKNAGSFFTPADTRCYSRLILLALNEAPARGITTLLAEDAAIETLVISESSQKASASQAVIQHLLDHGCGERTADVIATTADELLMNAIYDSRVDGAGKQLLFSADDTEGFNVHGVELNIGVDSDFVAIHVSDCNGSLDRQKVLRHISKVTESPEVQNQHLNESARNSAGIGLALIVRSGASLCFVTEPGKWTEVTAFFPGSSRAKKRTKDFKSQFQFISTFIIPAQDSEPQLRRAQ